MTILDEILERKRSEVAAAKLAIVPEAMAQLAEERAEPTRGFRAALVVGEGPAVIAEIKRRSPSKGEIRAGFDPVACALGYRDGGAAAISVLTDEHYFGGQLDYLEKVRAAVDLPLLRKDFVVEAYQIDEARARGADAVLLIVSAFEGPDCSARLAELRGRATALGLDTLVEVHDEAQLDLALESGADLVGVNNRDLRTFEVDLSATQRLAVRAPAGTLIVAESGIVTPADISRLEAAGASAFLVGESLMRESDLAEALRRLRRRV